MFDSLVFVLENLKFSCKRWYEKIIVSGKICHQEIIVRENGKRDENILNNNKYDNNNKL